MNGGTTISAASGAFCRRISACAWTVVSATANRSELEVDLRHLGSCRDTAVAEFLERRVAHDEEVVLGLVEDVGETPQPGVDGPADDVGVGDQREVVLDERRRLVLAGVIEHGIEVRAPGAATPLPDGTTLR